MLLTFQTCSKLPWRPTRLDGFHESTLQITKIAEQRLVLASGFSWLGVLGIRSFWFKGIGFVFFGFRLLGFAEQDSSFWCSDEPGRSSKRFGGKACGCRILWL